MFSLYKPKNKKYINALGKYESAVQIMRNDEYALKQINLVNEKLAEEKLGDKFNIRTFHDQMLKNGSLPMALLEELTIDWVNQQLY